MAAGKKQKKKSERLEFKLTYKVSRKLYPDPAAAAYAIRLAKEEFLDSGDPDAVRGIHVVGMWRNPDNGNPRHRQWKTSDDPDQSPSGFIKTIMERTGRL